MLYISIPRIIPIYRQAAGGVNEQYNIFNISLNIIVFDISPALNISISKMIPISGKRWVECTNKGQISIPESIDPETQVLFLSFHVWTFSTIFCFQFHNFSKWSNIFQSYKLQFCLPRKSEKSLDIWDKLSKSYRNSDWFIWRGE